jgi:hypothetical protein
MQAAPDPPLSQGLRRLSARAAAGTAALSAVLVAPLVVSGDVGEYAALSAMLAIMCWIRGGLLTERKYCIRYMILKV